jgi:exodeoxyribonuclease VII large subunit
MEPVFSVSEFNEAVANHLSLLGEVTVEGELSELKVSQGKWVYATLKDDEASVSLFGMVWQIRNLHSLDVGMKVTVSGIASLYRKTARFSINATSIIPSGEGALLAAYEKLKAQLEAEGLFAPERKRPLPQFPERIGLLTARDSQAYQDFVKVSSERIGGFKIFFYPVNVQGGDAVSSVMQGLTYFNEQKNVDIIVVTRGGGSLEDLAAFSDEQLVRAVYASTIPTVCAIGHEGDVSLIELAADLRASTPSNAAELIFRDRESVLWEIESNVASIEENIQSRLEKIGRETDNSLNTISHFYDRSVSEITMCIHQFTHTFESYSLRVEHTYHMIAEIELSLYKSLDAWFRLMNERVTHLEDKLRSLDPAAVLRRGFSVLRDKSGALITTVANVTLGESMYATMSDGTIESNVIAIKKEKNERS